MESAAHSEPDGISSSRGLEREVLSTLDGRSDRTSVKNGKKGGDALCASDNSLALLRREETASRILENWASFNFWRDVNLDESRTLRFVPHRRAGEEEPFRTVLLIHHLHYGAIGASEPAGGANLHRGH